MGQAAGRLAGRRIIVTGAGSGMGAAIARTFAREGAALLLLDISADAVRKVAEETGQHGLQADVASEADIARAVTAAAEKLGGIDGLVNAAGILRHGSLDELTPEVFRKILDVNLMGPYLLIRAALPHLRQAKSATIVNIASMAALRPPPGMPGYAASKAGLVAFGQALAPELGPTIRINAICPGIIRTPMIEFMWSEGGPGDAGVAAALQLGRPGAPEEIADCALYLTSEESSFVSMAAIPINGGQLT